MLQIKQIRKEYRTGNMVQKALDGVSLNLRENEFVAILGPSGSGKTTLLNIIGGLDRYDSGDLIINGISTKKYKDRDWDSYRNHTIGFVFQSYNLIPHQTVLSNVELALTISGISRTERRRRAKEALEKVGLGAQLHKKPNQMSGGQMQRVAIARALVNDPDILLADEPTGALDSDTSVQVMELLKEVAKERLVVMVTHNPELAEIYATRIVNLKDGEIISDSDPFEVDEKGMEAPLHENMGKASMSFRTALSLSFNNLRTKKARTLLTSFAGSIGIIGIALILSISNGVNTYIHTMEEETLSEYPVQISSTGLDLASMMVGAAESQEEKEPDQIGVSKMITNMFSKMDSNDLESLKQYLESGESGIEQYVNSVEYSYQVAPQIYTVDGNKIRQVNPDKSFSSLGLGSSVGSNSLMAMAMSTDVFFEMPGNPELYQDQYEVKAGKWPEQYNECVLVLTQGGNISDFLLYTLGLRDAAELDEMIRQFAEEENVETPTDIRAYSCDEILGTAFKLVNSTDYYEYDEEYHVWKDKSDDKAYMRQLVKAGEDLVIVGIVQPAEGSAANMLNTGIGYTQKLTQHIIEQSKESRIVQDQLAQPDKNVFTGEPFGEDETENKFDLESLFEIDEDALRESFGMDESMFSLDLSGLDLSGMNISMPNLNLNMEGSMPDLSQIIKPEDIQLNPEEMMDMDKLQVDLPAGPEINKEELMKSLQLSVTEEDLQRIFGNILKGFQESIKDKPEADLSRVQDSFMSYLSSQEVQQKLYQDITELMRSGVTVSVSNEQVLGIVAGLVAGFQSYLTEHSITEPGIDSVLAYLTSREVQQKITQEAENIIRNGVSFQISPEQIQEIIIKDVVNGYQEYAKANTLPDLSNLGDYFMEYLKSDAGQKIIGESIASVINTEQLEKQFTDMMQSYMKQIMNAYAETMGQEIQKQIAASMNQISEQLGAELEKAMEKMVKNISTGMQSALQQVMVQITANMSSALQGAMGQFSQQMEDAMKIDPELFMDAIQMNMDEDELSELLMSLISYEDASYDNNLKKLGYADLEKPGAIDIYPVDFESKAEILHILDNYNYQMEQNNAEEKVITYTDFVGTLMSSVTKIVEIISYVLVAFVAISLVVSSIMIGVITYISVLERNKEIGILRAIGASKRNISQVFNAETFIIGLCAGLIGIGLTLLLLIPGNMVIHSLAGTSDINASLPYVSAAILIALSIVLTLMGGLIPSRKAAKSDPVKALRSE
ncbi:MAG: ABC transporter ATP-binding protein/permease [Candidatus Choladocola sp.]|nr:ABC transporter ATP-binding protein/permease [Candidatus Choladocola sp.]